VSIIYERTAIRADLIDEEDSWSDPSFGSRPELAWLSERERLAVLLVEASVRFGERGLGRSQRYVLSGSARAQSERRRPQPVSAAPQRRERTVTRTGRVVTKPRRVPLISIGGGGCIGRAPNSYICLLAPTIFRGRQAHRKTRAWEPDRDPGAGPKVRGLDP
jgi:hypothetical protein